MNAFVGHFVTVLGKLGWAQGLSAEESQDAVQESFVIFFKKLDEVRPEVKLSTFLFGIFANSVHEARRKRGRIEAHGDLAAIENLIDQNYDDRGHWIKGVAPVPLESLLANENTAKLENCVQSLPDKHKLVVLATLDDELDSKELCHSLGLTYVNFRQLLTRARHALRICLENHVKGSDHA